MSRTVDYSALAGKAKRDKALMDCKFWLGDERFDKMLPLIAGAIKEEGTKENFILMSLSMVGIQGYPAQAMIDEALGRDYPAE